MIVLDLALQGIRDLGGSMRVRLQSGYNAIVTPEIQPETVVVGLTHMLYATALDPEGASLAAPGAHSIGGGVTLMTPDGSTYRVVRDLITGSAQLMEFDRQTKKFTQLATVPDEVTQILRARAGLPSREAFETLFVLRSSDLPSGPPPVEIETTASEETGPSLEELKAQLQMTESVLEQKKEIEASEFKLDGMQKRRFDIEDKMRAMAPDPTALDEARDQLRRLRYLDPMDDTFGVRYESHLALARRRDSDLQRWQSERTTLEHSGQAEPPDPLLKDWRLWIGLLVGTLAIVAGFVLGDNFRYLAFADIPAYGLAAFVLFRNLTQREESQRLTWRLKLSDERKRKIEARDQQEIEAVEAILSRVGIQDPGEVRNALQTRQAVKQRIRELGQEAERAANDPQLKRLQDEHTELMTTIGAIEERLSTLTAVPVDAGTLQVEIESLRQRIAAMEPEEPAADVEALDPIGPFSSGLAAALDVMLTDPATASKTLSERASLMIRPLSKNRVMNVILEPTGAVAMKSAQGGVVAWDEMPGAARDLIYLALRGALFVVVEEQMRAPLVAGDLSGYVSGGREVIQTLFVTLGHAGQILHTVRRPDDAPQATHVVTVGQK